MASEYAFVPLRDFSVRITKGTTPVRGKGFMPRGINYIKSEAISPAGTIDASKFSYIDDRTHQALARSQLSAGNVLFSMAGVYLGKTAVVKTEHVPANTNQAVGIITLDLQRAEPFFVHYALQSPECRSWVARSAAQSAQPNFNLQQIGDLPIPNIPLHTQQALADTLKTFDDRIELLRQTNTTLEAIAQALFKSWFVDFDPVHAKAEGREPDGMDAATAALFPSAFEDSPHGPIPQGWQARSLDSIANYLNGLALQKFPPESAEEFLPVIKIAQLRAGNTAGADRASTRLKPEYVVHDGDVLFSWSGTLEVEFWCGGDGALNQHLFKVTSTEVPKWFYYLATRQHLHMFRQIAASKATTMGHIQRQHLTHAKIAVPPLRVLTAATEIIEPLLERRISNALQMRQLAELRDTLLPRLISGKLRLPDAQTLSEEVDAL